MLHKFAFILLLFITLFISPVKAYAAEEVNIYLFWGSGCPHCAKEKIFLEKFKNEYPVKIYEYEIWYNPSNRDLFNRVGIELKAQVSAVPFTVIGDKHIQGYLNDETTGKEIEDNVNRCLKNICPDPVGQMLGVATEVKPNSASNNSPVKKPQEVKDTIPKELNLPLFGNIKTKDVSLPVLTILIAALDGFNPCAMWTLIFLISLLIGLHDRKRMWILGSTFIAASAFVYFMFMAAWLHLILFIGFIFWIRIIIGLVAVSGGIYNLREYFINKESACKVTRSGERRMVFEKLKLLVYEKHFWLAMGGIILLAAAVNIVELICSAGLPVIYTQILTLSNLAPWQYYMYLFLYIFIFMLDDLFVFIVSIKTLEIAGVTTKYSRFSHLIGGILMTVLGIILIFKPELLMFG